MAITGADRERVALGMLGATRRTDGPKTERALALWGMEHYGTVSGANYQAMQGIARQLIRSRGYIDTIEGDPLTPHPTTGVPISPTIREGEPRYQYRVVLVYRDSAGNIQVEMAVNVTSDTPLSADAIYQQAFLVGQHALGFRQYRDNASAIDQTLQPEAHIILAGRRA